MSQTEDPEVPEQVEDLHAEQPGPQQGEPAWELEFSEDEDVDDEEVDDFLDEVDEMDMDEAWDEEAPDLDSGEQDDDEDAEEWMSDEEEDYLSPKHRAQLECGVLEHDVNFFVTDTPTDHSQVPSSTCHHQTADAITFLPGPGTASVSSVAGGPAAAVTAASVDVEEVLVSHRTTLSIYQLTTNKPARLLARSGTCFKHYSIATSPCGNFVAASGSQGVLALFRVVRSNQPGHQQTAAASDGGDSGGVGSSGPGLPWQLIHEATLLCVNARESMVNSVRFGQFAGLSRLLVSHQDGMLYLFNLPNNAAADQQAATPSAGTPAPGQPAAASDGARSSGGAAPVAGALLMVRGLPDWEPQGSQINRRYVEQLLAVLDRHSQQQRHQYQLQQAGDVEGSELQQQTIMQAEYEAQERKQQQGPMDAGAAGPSQPPAFAGHKRQQQQSIPAPSAAKVRRMNPEPLLEGPDDDVSVEAQLTNVSEGLGGLGLGGSGPGAPEARVQPQPGSLQHLMMCIKAAEQLLTFLVQNLAATCTAAKDLQQRFGPTFPGTGPRSFMSCSWADKCRCIGQLLQDEEVLTGVQRLQRLRFIFADESIAYKWIGTVKEYTAVVNSLRQAAQAQAALVGPIGHQRQQQQWQQQQDDGDPDFCSAMDRAVYVLLLLRLLAPTAVPTMKPSARVLLLKHGPEVDPRARLTAADTRAAPRLQTCAISNIAIDTAAQQRAAAAAREAERLQAVAQQQGASAAAVAAAAVAAQDADIAALEQQILPLNICESSPDGSWLALGVDQAAILLMPAGTSYQHQACQVLDLCPPLAPRTNHWQQAGTLGCQYLAFNSSSTLLAATSDHLRLVSVFEVATGQLLATFSLHNRPVLPVRFMSNFIRRDFSKTSSRGKKGHDGQQAVRQQQQKQKQTTEDGGSCSSSAGEAAGQDAVEAGDTVVHEMWGDHVLIYCESRGGLHIADMSTFITPGDQGAQSRSAVTAVEGEAHQGQISHKFCLMSYIEVPPEPAARLLAAEPAVQAGVADQQQQHHHHQDQAEAMLDAALLGQAQPAAAGGGGGGTDAAAAAQKINGLVVTPAGRVLVACSDELLEWQLISGWSPDHHRRFPPAFRQAAKLLLMAATPPCSSEANTADMVSAAGQASASALVAAAEEAAGGVDGRRLLSQLPSAVLERIIADAALPQGKWAAIKVPTLQQLLAALNARPHLPEGEMHGPMVWPFNMFPGAPAVNPAGAVGPVPVPGGMPPGALQMMMQLQAMAQMGAMPAAPQDLGAPFGGQGQQPQG